MEYEARREVGRDERDRIRGRESEVGDQRSDDRGQTTEPEFRNRVRELGI